MPTWIIIALALVALAGLGFAIMVWLESDDEETPKDRAHFGGGYRDPD